MAVEDIARPAPSTTAPGPGDSGHVRENCQRGGGDDDLCRSEGEYGSAHDPEALGAEFQADEEEQHDDAERGDVGDLADVVDQAQAGGADGDSGQ